MKAAAAAQAVAKAGAFPPFGKASIAAAVVETSFHVSACLDLFVVGYVAVPWRGCGGVFWGYHHHFNLETVYWNPKIFAI